MKTINEVLAHNLQKHGRTRAETAKLMACLPNGFLETIQEYAQYTCEQEKKKLDTALAALSLMFRRSNQLINTLDADLIPIPFKTAVMVAKEVIGKLADPLPENEKLSKS